MGLISLIAPRHNVAATMRANIVNIADDLGSSIKDFQARSAAVHMGNGQISVGAGAIPLTDPAVEGAMKLVNSKALDKALAPRRLAEGATPSAVHDARAAVATARGDFAMTKEMKKAKGTLTVNSIDVQSTLQRLNDSLGQAVIALSSKATEQEIKAAAPVRKLATMGRVSVLGAGAATGAVYAIPGAKDAVQQQATALYAQYKP